MNLILEITLHMLKDNNLATDLIINRDFLNTQKITAFYMYLYSTKQKIVSRSTCSRKHFYRSSLVTYLIPLENTKNVLTVDFGAKVKNRLKDLLLKIDSALIQ